MLQEDPFGASPVKVKEPTRLSGRVRENFFKVRSCLVFEETGY